MSPGGHLCAPCLSGALAEFELLRKEFDALIEAGISRDEANRMMIERIEGRTAKA